MAYIATSRSGGCLNLYRKKFVSSSESTPTWLVTFYWEWVIYQQILSSISNYVSLFFPCWIGQLYSWSTFFYVDFFTMVLFSAYNSILTLLLLSESIDVFRQCERSKPVSQGNVEFIYFYIKYVEFIQRLGRWNNIYTVCVANFNF